MIKLVFPTIYEEIVQGFAENGGLYWELGLPGHDGIDFRAPFHSKVFAAADGTVKHVNRNLSERFGLFVVIAHAEGYETLYGYLGKVMVAEGDVVRQNEVIALSGDAENRGYLHFGLYNPGLERLKHSSYPNGELDPRPFLRYDKQNFVAKSMIKMSGGSVRGERRLAKSMDGFEAETVERVVLPLGVERRVLRGMKSNAFVVMVVDVAVKERDASAFVKRIRAELGRGYQEGVRYFQIGKAPNLFANGMNEIWQSPGEFARWWIDVCSPLRERYPEIRLGYPALAQGDAVAGIRFDSKQFLLESGDAIAFADWVGFEYVWQSRKDLQGLMKRNELGLVGKIAPAKPRIVTGYGAVDYLLGKEEGLHYYEMFEEWVETNDLADFYFKIVV